MIPDQKMNQMLVNAFISRSALNAQLLDGKYGTRDIDSECGYPEALGPSEYVQMYERNDIAARVVDIEPAECWKQYPEIYETEEERETPFEKAVDKVIRKTNLYSYLARVDRISGIGRYGILFLGFDDGQEFDKPVPGFTVDGEADSVGNANILYYRIFEESQVIINEYENDTANPRFGLPKYYSLTFAEYVGDLQDGSTVPSAKVLKVHWSRCIHIADNLVTSELFGTPRMKNVFNRLFDLRKINGGSAEMFWKGGFPGYSFEVDPKAGEFSTEEREALKAETKAYSEGLQRYLTTVGVSVKSLSPQISNPTPFVDNILRTIAITKGIPQQVFVGSVQGKTDAVQDLTTWAEKVALRRNMYCSPHIIRPTIDRLIQAGALPKPTEDEGEYTIKWIPLATLTETEKAQVGKDLTEALARYSTAGGEALVPLPEFLSKFLKFSFQEVEAIMKAPHTELSVVIQELNAGLAGGNTGAANGNMPTSIPNMAKAKDPGKTPQNVVQRKKGSTVTRKGKDQGLSNPPTAQG